MLYRYKIKPISPIVTPLMSDTFFGHFCWAVLYHQGEDYLSDLLDSYNSEKPAPVLFSSAFLSGYLPRPVMQRLTTEKMGEFVRKHFGKDKKTFFEGMSKISAWDHRQFISVKQWLNLKDNYSEERLYEEFITEHPGKNKVCETEAGVAKRVNRIGGIVPDRSACPFYKEKIWYYEDIAFDLYVEINDEEMNTAVRWFLTEYLPENGFGADKSTGMGCLAIVHDEDFDPKYFSVAAPDARVSLSMTAFQGMETYRAAYRLITKFGKLGGDFAFAGTAGGTPKPFKKPVLMYEPGAVFFCSESLSDRPLLENIHSDKRIRHCGIPITLPFVRGQ